jgi:hypothetical protein
VSDNDTPQEERRVRPFADFLTDHNNGAGHRQAGEALQRLVSAVVETGKKGTVTVKVSVEQMKGAEGTLVTHVEVAEKLPVNPPKGAVFYADEDGNLTRTDPNQPVISGLREVSAPEVRDRAAAGGDR